MSKIKRPTQKEKIAVYEDLLHNIQLYAEVTMDEERMKAIVRRICAWSYAHRQGNGEHSEEQINAHIDHNFWKLDVHNRNKRPES